MKDASSRDSISVAPGAASLRRTLLAAVWPAAAVALGVLALFLRWDRLQFVTFRGDQAWSINRALDFVAHGDFPFTGIRSSIGTAQGAIEIYLLALPVALNPDPAVATAFVGLLQALAVVGTFFFAGRYFGRGVGLSAALLYAVNPWAVNYARRIWTQDMLPLFALLFIACLFLAVVERRRYFFALACALQIVLLLLHPAAVIYLPLLVAVGIVYWRRIGPRPFLLGALLGLVVALPYIYGEYLLGFPSLGIYAGMLGQGGGVDLGVFTALPTLASARYFPTMMGDSFRGAWALPDLTLQNVLLGLLLYLGLALAVWRVARGVRRRASVDAAQWKPYLLIALWFLLPSLASTRNSVGFQLSYFIVFYPLPFLLAALALGWFYRLLREAGRRRSLAAARPLALGGLLVLAYLAAPQAAYVRQYLDYFERNGPQGSYGVPLTYSQQAIARLRELRAGVPEGEVYYYGTAPQGLALRYLGRPDPEVRRVEPNASPLLPADLGRGALAVVGPEDEAAPETQPVPADGPLARRLAALGFVEAAERAVRGPDGLVHYRLYSLAPAGAGELPPGFRPAPRAASLPSGLRLAGYSLPPVARAGETALLTLLWQVPDGLERYRHSSEEFLLFAHLLDGAGRQLGNAEADPLISDDWRPGDLMATFHEYTLPAGRGPEVLWFDLGAFRRYGREGLPWTDGGEQFPALRVGPLRVAAFEAAPAPATTLDLRFGDALALAGFDRAPRVARAGAELNVTLHWQGRARPERDYTVSVQLLDAAGALVAQHDGPPAGGAYPTSFWEGGETVSDTHTLLLPPALPEGEYSLTVVVYSADDGARLPVKAAGGEDLGERALLENLRMAW